MFLLYNECALITKKDILILRLMLQKNETEPYLYRYLIFITVQNSGMTQLISHENVSNELLRTS